MTFLNKIPGSFLIFLGALCLSFGGIIVKSFEGANLWQILFWRQLFFSIIVVLYLLIAYKKNFFKTFYESGLPGFAAGFFLSFGFGSSIINSTLLIFILYFFLNIKLVKFNYLDKILIFFGIYVLLSSLLNFNLINGCSCG